MTVSLHSVSGFVARRSGRPQAVDPTVSAATSAAIGRYSRALTRFEHLAGMTADRQVRRELDWMHEALAGMLELVEEGVARHASTVEPKAIHRAATLCTHAAEMVLHLQHYLRLGDRHQAGVWLAQVLQTVHSIEDLIDPSSGVAVSA